MRTIVAMVAGAATWLGVVVPGAGAARLGQLPRQEVDVWLGGLARAGGDLAARTSAVSARLVGTRYVRDPLGEGPQGRFDRGPLIDLGRVDCLTFVEQVLALAQRPTVEAATRLLQRYRYDHGKIDYRARRHFMELQWLPGLVREGFLEDITARVAGPAVKVFRRNVTRRNYRKGFHKWLRRLGPATPTGEIALSYLPARAAPGRAAHIPEGAILSLLLRAPRWWPGAISHVALVARRGNDLVLRHALSASGKVIEVPLVRYLRAHARDGRTLGFHFSLPRPAPPAAAPALAGG